MNYEFNNQSYVRCLSVTYLQTGHFHKPFSQFSLRYDSRSKHCKRKIRTADSSNSFGRKRRASKFIVGISASGTWIWRQSWPLAGRPIRLKVNGHRRLTFFFSKLREKIVKQTVKTQINNLLLFCLCLCHFCLTFWFVCSRLSSPREVPVVVSGLFDEGYFLKQSRNHHNIARARKKDPPGGREGVEVALDLGDAVLQGQQPLSQESLEHRSHARPAGKRSSLFGLKDIKEWVCGGSWDKPTTKIVQFAKKQPMDEGQRGGRRTNTNTDTNTHISTKQTP